MYSKSARDAWADTLQLPAEVRCASARQARFAKRYAKHVDYARAGLNGPRAVARRLAAIKRTGRLADGRVAHLARWLEKVA